MSKYSLKPEQTTTAVKKLNMQVLRELGKAPGQERGHCRQFSRGAGGMSTWNGSKPRGVQSTARGLCPSRCCSPMKYLGFWTLLIPSCPPQQVHFPYMIYGCPLSSSSRPAEEGKPSPQTGEGYVPNPYPRGQGQDPSLTSYSILIPHNGDTHP